MHDPSQKGLTIVSPMILSRKVILLLNSESFWGSYFKQCPIQVLAVIRRRPEVQKISFVAHSLGGLVARYAIGRLFDHIPKYESSGAPESFSAKEQKQHIEQFHHARIAGLEPVNFITVATPHLGSRGNKQVITLIYTLQQSDYQSESWKSCSRFVYFPFRSNMAIACWS